MGFDVCWRNLRNALSSQRWRKVLLLLILRPIKGTWRKVKGYVPNRIVKRRKNLLEQIETVFPDQYPMNLSREALTGNANVIAAHIEWPEALFDLILWGGFCVLMISALFIPGTPLSSFMASVPRAFNSPIGAKEVLALEIVYALAVFVLEAVLWALWVRLLKWAAAWGVHPITALVLGCVIPAGGGFASVYTGHWRESGNWLWRSTAEGTFLLSVMAFATGASATLATAVEALVESKRRWSDPRTHLLRALFNALRQVIALKEDQRWTDPKERNRLVTWLEEAAKCLEVIPKTISGRDRFSSRWNQQEYLRRASGIRDLKKWVLLPKAETCDYLEQKLRCILQLTAIGDWDGLPQADLPEDAPVSWWRRAAMIIRSVIIAGIPPVAVFIFGKYLPQQGDFKNYVTGAAWIWALISLLAMLDPRFGEKLSAFKDLPSFLPFGGKSKEP
jgi:hypothetical protein